MKLAKINPKKAPGPDKISGRCLREWSRELAPIVHYLFQQSVDTHTRCRAYRNHRVFFPFQKNLDHPRTMTIDMWPSLPSDEMSGTTSSPAHLHGNVTVSRSSSVCLQAKQEYRRCNYHTCSPCSETPGYTQNFSPYSLLGLFKRFQHYPATYTTPETESHACESIIAQVDLGFSYRQKTVCEDQQHHFFYHHNKRWRPPPGLCEFTSTVLSVSDCNPVDSSISKDHLFKYADDKALLGLIT